VEELVTCRKCRYHDQCSNPPSVIHGALAEREADTAADGA
jgi:hypothetical protein